MSIRRTQFSLKIKRNVRIIFDTSKGLVLGHMAVATRPGRLPIRGKVEAASPSSVVMVPVSYTHLTLPTNREV